MKSRGASLPGSSKINLEKLVLESRILINANTHTKPYTHPEELADKLNYTYT